VKKILAVDDSASIRQMLGFTLRNAGYEVVDAVDGKDGLARAGKDKFDMIITDLNMPNMDGLSMIREIRKLTIQTGTPIVFLTTESDDAIKQEARNAGATGWLVKPFKPEQLLRIAQKVLGR